MLQCFSVDLVEGKVNLVCASVTATIDIHATTCLDLGEITDSLDL